MNILVVGNSEKSEHILQRLDLTRPFLIVDDGPLIEALKKPLLEATPTPNKRKLVWPDFSHDSFNPLEGMTYLKARSLATTLYTASPQGENTLTVRNGKRALTRILLENPKRLDKLRISAAKMDAGTSEAMDTIKDMLLSPVLGRVFCNKPTIPKRASIIARIDRAEFGDFDAFILANLLINQFEGQVIVPDGGFYLRDHHSLLIRQDRLMAGANYFGELPERLRKALLPVAIPAGQCTWEDAETLADYAGLSPGTNAYVEFTQRAVE